MARTKEEKLQHAKEMAQFDSLFGYNLLAGVDEAGRGPLAGPVYAAAVILPEGLIIEGLDDSKKLSEKKREELFEIITEKAISYSIAWCDNEIIDEINIRNATYKAMNEAVGGLKVPPEYVLVDGDAVTNMKTPHMCVIKGDAKSRSIAAASILAKVSRDRFITKMAEKYPQYGFEKHKGYGTKLHMDMIKEHGPCPVHRKSFIKNIKY